MRTPKVRRTIGATTQTSIDCYGFCFAGYILCSHIRSLSHDSLASFRWPSSISLFHSFLSFSSIFPFLLLYLVCSFSSFLSFYFFLFSSSFSVLWLFFSSSFSVLWLLFSSEYFILWFFFFSSFTVLWLFDFLLVLYFCFSFLLILYSGSFLLLFLYFGSSSFLYSRLFSLLLLSLFTLLLYSCSPFFFLFFSLVSTSDLLFPLLFPSCFPILQLLRCTLSKLHSFTLFFSEDLPQNQLTLRVTFAFKGSLVDARLRPRLTISRSRRATRLEGSGTTHACLPMVHSSCRTRFPLSTIDHIL